MTTELSAILDELMGKNRNAAPDDKSNDVHWSDKDVCKHFLCGFCPAELFTNTRSDLGPCEKMHDEAMRKAYTSSSKYLKMNYEAEFLHYLQQCMQDVERRIRRNHQRLQLSEEKNQKMMNPSKDVEEQINVLTQRIEEMLQKIEQLGNEGNVEEAQGVMKLCDQLKEDREQLYGQKGNQVMDAFAVQEKQMEVCEVCGAFLIVGDAQSRVDDHLMGKQHMGYAKIKATIEELKEKLRSKPTEQKLEVEPEAKRVRRSSHDGTHDKRRSSRSNDDRGISRRSKSRDRKRDDRDKDRRHSRDRDRRRSRDRNIRSSHGERSRESDRHRSRDRDRDGRHSRDHRSRDDRDRKSHRSRSRDKDRRTSRKHSKPRSKSRDRKDHKRSRRSDSREKRRERAAKKEEGRSDQDKKDDSVTGKNASAEGGDQERDLHASENRDPTLGPSENPSEEGNTENQAENGNSGATEHSTKGSEAEDDQ